MDQSQLYWGQFLIATLWVVIFFLERLAELLNLYSAQQPLSEELSKIQPPAEHQKAFDYLSDQTRPTWLKEIILLVGFLALFFGGGFAWIYHFATHSVSHPVLQGLLFLFVLSLLQSIIILPFSYYSTFKIEEKYGFNRTTLKTFITDLIKGTLVSWVLLGILFWFSVTLFTQLGNTAWFWIWVGFSIFQLFLTWIAPVALLPLFLKLTPLPEGELSKAIQGYSQNQKFKLNGVWVCDASKRSSKSNAFFTGFGRYRRLVLFDTLVEKHTTEEIVSVVAHEAGHFKLGHIWKSSLLSLGSTFVLLWLAQRLIDSPLLYAIFGTSPPHTGLGLILSFLVLGKAMFFSHFLTNAFSRKNEFEADRFSIQTYPHSGALISALKRLTLDHLSILNPHPFYIQLFSSHPPLIQRANAIRSYLKEKA